jgi:predicted DNA repair protein MutK
MASSLLALLDDIAAVLDDVAVLSKVAARKSAGVLGGLAPVRRSP